MTDVASLPANVIEQGWRDTFSTNNPYCPCDLKSFTKAVRWAERALASPAPSAGVGVEAVRSVIRSMREYPHDTMHGVWADALETALQHPAAPSVSPAVAGDGLPAFAEWLVQEMPPGTVISNPRWWAPRIFRQIAISAPQGDEVGQWVRCSPDLLNAGVSCANTPRRPGDGTYSHDHFIAHGATPPPAPAAEHIVDANKKVAAEQPQGSAAPSRPVVDEAS